MKTDALKEKGLTQEQIDFVMAENGKDLNALKSQNANLTVERDELKGQLQTAQDTLKSFENVDLDTIKKDLATWKKKAEDAEKTYNAKIAERDFEDALKAETDSIKFSSNAAKNDVLSQIRAAKLNVSNGKILGLNDLIAQIKEKDSSAFVDEKQEDLEKNKAKFTSPMSGGSGGGKLTKADIMAIKDAAERQQAIAENIDLFM